MVLISDTNCTSSMDPRWEFLAPQFVDFNNLEEEGEGDSFFTAHEEDSGQEVGGGDHDIGETKLQDIILEKQKNPSGSITIAMYV